MRNWLSDKLSITRMEEFDYEKHKDDFMMYVWNNLDDLNYCIRKNITYDDEIYDDVTSDTLVRLAEYIVRKRVKVKDFKNLFFISAKRQYIAEQQKKRDKQKLNNRDFFDNIFNGLEKREEKRDLDKYYSLVNDVSMADEVKAEKTHKLFRYLEQRLNEVFDGNEVDIFLIYFRLKSEKNGISYKKLADIMDKDVKYITKTIVKIKKYIKEDNDIQEFKKNIMKYDDDDTDII